MMPANIREKARRQRSGEDQKQSYGKRPGMVDVPQAREGKKLMIAGYILGTGAVGAWIGAEALFDADITLAMFFFLGLYIVT